MKAIKIFPNLITILYLAGEPNVGHAYFTAIRPDFVAVLPFWYLNGYG